MKRYQCIKNVYYPKADPATGRMIPTLSFSAGSVYPCRLAYPGEFEDMVDDNGNTHIVTHELMTNFQELLDLHVDDIPRDEADREPFTTPQPRRKLTAGWAWFIALVITIGFFVLKAFTE